ncbi:MAG: hypothetical protein ACYC9S_00850 [Leptospirales bacterium]
MFAGERVLYQEGKSDWESLQEIPPLVRLLLGTDGSLTRALEFLGRGPVSVDLMKPPSESERVAYLCMPGLGRVVLALTSLSEPVDPRNFPVLTDPRPIGPRLLETHGPLHREGLSIFQSFGTGLSSGEEWERVLLWGRVYDLIAHPGLRLTIREWFLPVLVSFLEFDKKDENGTCRT